ncbi:unnamed protein product [Prorocentrum cordatum]|uniref:USP domain-containing protein n=1 Tax=Prorocentrum cordatum TaxID=2364126 RepID=A0ABN9VXJ6_9DINO|nr:unnamed protein product [Polarella glacialis]
MAVLGRSDIGPFVEFVQRQMDIQPGRQQGAAECVKQLLHVTGLGKRHCDSESAIRDYHLILTEVPDVAQVSAAATPIDAQTLLLTAASGDGALRVGSEALVIRFENAYEQGGKQFWVDAKVKWPSGPLTLTFDNAREEDVEYDVQGYIVHVHAGSEISQGMRSGHYIAYFKHRSAWYLADDATATELGAAPADFPCIVFLARRDRRQSEHVQKLQERAQGVKRLQTEAPRTDDYSSMGHPYRRFCENYGRYRKCSEERGGMQRCRNAYLAHIQLAPRVVSGQEWRAIVANFAEFFGRSATDWEKPTDQMEAKLQSEEGLRPEERWQRRHLQACVFCARSHWVEELHREFPAGKDYLMDNPDAVWELLDVEDYHKRWPKIPLEELESSAVIVAASGTTQENGKTEYRVLLHKRRVSQEQAAWRASVYVCSECKWAFGGPRPFLCKYALANDMWLGRWGPLFRDADVCPLSHQMLLALARVVSTEIVLRPDGGKNKTSDSTATWGFLFHQSGVVGTAVPFQNADCKWALEHWPDKKLHDSFAVAFVASAAQEVRSSWPGKLGNRREQARKCVSRIAKLMADRRTFDAQADALANANIVYSTRTCDKDLVASWVPDPQVPVVPPVILDAVVGVPLEDSPGQVVAEGPADAAAAGEDDRMDADIAAAREARYIAAFEQQTTDFNRDKNGGSMQITALMQQLEELDHAAQRSVAAEVEPALEGGVDCGGEGGGLVDREGRERILDMPTGPKHL